MAANEKDILKLTKEIHEGFNRGDLNILRNNVADNAILTAVPQNLTFKGPAGAVEYFSNYKQAFPDATINVKRQIACTDTVVTEFRGQGTQKGVFKTPMGDIPPTGRKIDVPVCQIMRWKDGKIIEILDYFDSSTLMANLGIGVSEERHVY